MYILGELLLGKNQILNTSGFELFKSRGMDLISNESIKIKLLEIYEEKIQIFS